MQQCRPKPDVLPRGIAREGPAEVSRTRAESLQASGSRGVRDDGGPQAVVPTAVWNGQPTSKVGVAMTEGQHHGGEGQAKGACTNSPPRINIIRTQTLRS
jgi:hypothetical protein